MSMQLIVESRSLLDVVQVEVGGFALWVREESGARRWDLDVAAPILAGDEYELQPLLAERRQLRWVLDVGGHVGSFTLKVKRGWPEARVIAAEPDPDNAALFRKNTEGLAGVVLEEAAVLGRRGIEHAHLRQAGRANHDSNAAASSVLEVSHPLKPHQRRATALVRAVSVLDLLERHAVPRLDLLKLDCEGAEGEILEALAESGWLKRVGWIRGEWHGFDNLARVEAALRDTHTYAVQRSDYPWGSFIAHHGTAAVMS
jgi:FkbM family methyltransferase